MSSPASGLDLLKERELDNAYDKGWQHCKKAVLRILKQDWTGCDLSINSCDQHYIDKIEKL